MSKYKRGVCRECKVKEGDSSKKILYQCKFCERWFCAKHFEPRLVRIPDYDAFVKYPEVRVTFEEEWRREDGHPDFAYSLERFKELDMEEKLHSKLIEDALNRSKAYRKKTQKTIPTQEPSQYGKPIPEKTYPSALPSPKQKRGSSVGRAFLVLGIIVLIFGVGLIVFPQSFHEEGEFVFQSLGRPVNAFDLGVIPKNVEIRVDYDVKEDPYGLSEGHLYVILINASELFIIDRAWNNRPTKELLYPHYTEFKFNNVDFDYYAYDGPSAEGSLSWVTTYETNYIVLVWLDDVGVTTLSLVYFIRIDATWHPYFTYGIVLTIVGFVTAGIGFAYRRYTSR